MCDADISIYFVESGVANIYPLDIRGSYKLVGNKIEIYTSDRSDLARELQDMTPEALLTPGISNSPLYLDMYLDGPEIHWKVYRGLNRPMELVFDKVGE